MAGETSKLITQSFEDLIGQLPSEESQRAYRSDWRFFCAWLEQEGITVEGARTRDVQRYIVGQAKAKASRARSLSVIREVYGALVRDGLLEVNPAREVKNPRVGALPRSPVLDEGEMKRLLNLQVKTWRERRDQMAVRLLFGLGWRRSEVARLRVEHLDGETATGLFKGKKEVTVGVPAWLLRAIRRWLTWAGIVRGPVLPRVQGGSVAVTDKIVYGIVKRAARRAGLPEEKVTPHAIRRTKITLEGRRGVSLKERQLAVGHASQSTTERYDKAREASENAPGEVLADLVEEDE